ncbi:MAG: GreA/GreB family elongation factor [Salegentibacter sp.]|uniref:Transcription elongation factor GreB n=1 Tax=Salegentibacter flavus TaxID=287099 RepID=A0A1I4Z7I2_9FLAO|nr:MULTISPECIES: GreA/GreB family elongation factor [Salegentibacter]MDR9456251.1 GreA/GreB family elongation factor [Salegentibacter sp.]SFN46226.1 transcription elongation factor GreB [Salegentibacter flavus]
MSRGFVKEEDQEEAPLIPPRAALPEGVTNYVTPHGFDLLQEEKKDLEEQRTAIKIKDEAESRRAKSVIDGKLKLLNDRIATARILDPQSQAKEEVRFGATVKFNNKESGEVQQFTIVGVDEADVKKKKIAFIAPIARAVTGKKIGEIAKFNLGPETHNLEILEISY